MTTSPIWQRTENGVTQIYAHNDDVVLSIGLVTDDDGQVVGIPADASDAELGAMGFTVATDERIVEAAQTILALAV